MRTSLEGRLLRLTLDRPEKRNALNSDTCHQLVQAFEQAENDRRVGAILLDAEGPLFCSGMDLDESLLPDAAERTAIHTQLFTVGLRLHKPIIAAVQGAAIAGGLGLVANAHLVVAAEDASFSLPEIRIGMFPFVIWRAVALAVGERRALDLSLTGRKFGIAEAITWGLVHERTPASELAARARDLAAGIAGSSPEAIRRGMELVHQSRTMRWEEAVALASTLRGRTFQGPDYREGVRAFREKRDPRWPTLEDQTE